MKIVYNADGTPSSALMSGVLMTTSYAKSSKKAPTSPGAVEPNKEEETGAIRWVNWGDSNDYPFEVVRDIKQNGVAWRGLKIKADILYGKQLLPCKVVGFDPDGGKEIVEFVTDPEIKEFLRRSNINVFRDRMIHDYSWLGNAFPMLLLTEDRKKISMVAHDKAAKFRYEKFNKSLGRIDRVFRSGNWPNPAENQIEPIQCIDAAQAYLEVERVRNEKHFKYVFPVYSYDILNDYYSTVIHDSVRKNGWLENSTSIPAIVKAMIKNNMSLKYHIRIPLSYWKGLYKDWDRLKQKERDDIVSAKLTEMNEFLTGKDNAMKAFISHYSTDPNTGKEVAGWEIDALEDKMKYDAWNGVLAAADQEILFAMGVNPAIIGLISPGNSGGSKGGSNNGGSNIRESWLTAIASAQGERDVLHSWWPFVREYNDYDPDVELRTIDQVLTTLDQGKGTSKTVS